MRATELAFDGPLDWEAMLGYFSARAIPGVEHIGDGVYRRTIVVDGTPGMVELSLGGPDHLVLRSSVPTGEVRARRLFNLDADVGAAARHLDADVVVGPLTRARPGLRTPGAWDPFEVGVRAIVGQQVSVAGASTLTGRLADRHGLAVPDLAGLGLTRTFPTAATVADADLRGVGFTTARASAIRAFARAVAEGAIDLEGPATGDELVASIVAVRGLGPWTAEYIVLRLGDPDGFPAPDLGLRRAMARLTGTDNVSAADLAARAERWRPWRATAAIHLWLSG